MTVLMGSEATRRAAQSRAQEGLPGVDRNMALINEKDDSIGLRHEEFKAGQQASARRPKRVAREIRESELRQCIARSTERQPDRSALAPSAM
jgi:hypothetical protein